MMRPHTCRWFGSSQMGQAMEYEPQALTRLRQRIAHWSVRLSLRPRAVRIQTMRRKWGSCSTAGTVTLAADLAAQEEVVQDIVIVHELLHLRIRNHGPVFRALMSAHVPHWRTVAPRDGSHL